MCVCVCVCVCSVCVHTAALTPPVSQEVSWTHVVALRKKWNPEAILPCILSRISVTTTLKCQACYFVKDDSIIHYTVVHPLFYESVIVFGLRGT